MIGPQSFPFPHLRRFESEPTTIAGATAVMTFEHALGDVPDDVKLSLVCVTANNGYLVNEEIPLDLVFLRNGASDFNGRPGWLARLTADSVRVQISAADTHFTDTSLASAIFVAAQWKLKCICLKFRPI